MMINDGFGVSRCVVAVVVCESREIRERASDDASGPRPNCSTTKKHRSRSISRLLSRSRVQVSARLSCAGVSMEDLEHDSDTDSDPAYARGYDSPTDGDDLNLNNGTSMSLSLSLSISIEIPHHVL